MATSDIDLTEGTGVKAATHTISEDAVTKHIQRVNVNDSAGADILGTTADAASATTSVKAALRAIATALGVTALDLGSGTGGTRTLRTMIDSSQLDPTVAHDAADSGAPYKQGFKATTSLAGLTLVANADRTDGFAGVDGVQITRPHANLEDLLTPVPVAITDGSSTSVMASAGAGVKNYVTTCIIANTSATAVTVDLRDGAAGTVKATFPVPANTSGVVCNFPVPLGFSAATAVCADPSAAASTITVTLLGFKSKV